MAGRTTAMKTIYVLAKLLVLAVALAALFFVVGETSGLRT